MTERGKNHKAGFVSIIGLPNAGKSTLMNALMGEKLSIVTPKAQTTRNRIKGIYNDQEYQIIFSDTPGILEPQYEMQQKMMEGVKEVFQDSDAFVLVVDLSEKQHLPEEVIKKIQLSGKPILVLLNKLDLSEPVALEKYTDQYHQWLPEAEILPVSIKTKENVQFVLPKLKSWMPVHPPYYDKDSFTDQSERFFVNEIIREKILNNYQKEIPYSVEVVTESFQRSKSGIVIETIIYTERESQKGILLGHKGMRLRKVKNEAQKDISQFLGENITLNLFIKIAKNWRKDSGQLSKFGY